jgi:hypothetical protein
VAGITRHLPVWWLVSCSYSKMPIARAVTSVAQGTPRFDDHQQPGPPPDRGDAGGAEHGVSPRATRELGGLAG